MFRGGVEDVYGKIWSSLDVHIFFIAQIVFFLPYFLMGPKRIMVKIFSKFRCTKVWKSPLTFPPLKGSCFWV
jgi:hypothetical protein